MNIRASLTIGLPTTLLLLGGCIIVDGTTNNPSGSAGAGNDTITTVSSSSSSSSSSGSAGSGTGGAGGQGQGGAGVGGGGGTCVGPNDGILDALSCDKLNTKATGNVCGPMKNLEPLANGTCTHGFDIFQRGAFDVLSTCLQGIEGDPVNACDDTQVKKCIDVMYKAACPSQDAATACEGISTTLCIMGETFDTQGCLLDTNPLNTTALQDLANCIADPTSDPDCNKAYTACFAKLFAL